MYKYMNKIKIFSAAMIALFVFFVFYMIATNTLAYVPLEPSIVGGSTDVGASTYIASIYKMAIGIAGALAVLMIVIGGIQYTASMGNPGAIGAAKTRIWAAISGLILALFSYIILNTINPDLVNFNLELKQVNIDVSDTSKTFTCWGKAVKNKEKCIEKNKSKNCPAIIYQCEGKKHKEFPDRTNTFIMPPEFVGKNCGTIRNICTEGKSEKSNICTENYDAAIKRCNSNKQ